MIDGTMFADLITNALVDSPIDGPRQLGGGLLMMLDDVEEATASNVIDLASIEPRPPLTCGDCGSDQWVGVVSVDATGRRPLTLHCSDGAMPTLRCYGCGRGHVGRYR